jgi:S-formylglutathione hydrolase FrmB
MARRNAHRRRRRLAAAAALLVVAIVLWAFVFSSLGGVDTQGAHVLRYTIDSPLTHQELAQVAVVPGGSSTARRPLLVYLHGKGENQESNISSELFAAMRQLGARAPDVVFPDGGEDSYWHDRADGAWGEYVMREVIPQAIKRLHADPHRIAIGGNSMGGFGAYDLARLNPGRFCAVAGDSPALWLEGGESAEGAFDNAEDFARNDMIGSVVASSDPYPGARLWVDVGTEDPFRNADTALVKDLRAKGRAVQFRIWPGGHNQTYWRSHWNSYLRFYAAALANCS